MASRQPLAALDPMDEGVAERFSFAANVPAVTGPSDWEHGIATPFRLDRDRRRHAAGKSATVLAAEAQTPNDRLIWVLAEKRAGDDAQLLQLAEALGWSYQVLSVRRSLLRVTLDRIVDLCVSTSRRPAVVPSDGRWPDLVLGIGGRSVSLARRIKKASRGRTRLVFLGRPWAALRSFDLVITTPQYRLPDGPNVLHNLLPLNCPDESRLAEAASRWQQRLDSLPRPRLAVLVGGSSGSFRMTRASALRLAERASAIVEERGGSVLVTTSSRTPRAAADALVAALPAGTYAYRWRSSDPDNPYLGFLALADAFLVTNESASMIADALNTGRPVEVFGLEQRLLSRIMTSSWIAGPDGFPAASGRKSSKAERLRAWLAEQGYWIPARDLHRLNRALSDHGLLSTRWDAASGSRYEPELQRTLDRVLALFDPQPVSKALGSSEQ